MAEEGQNRPLKRSQFKDDDDEDRISTLPDCLLVEILSRLPETKHAIRTGALSKRWKDIWTTAHSLVFLHPYHKRRYHTNAANADFFSFINKTLTQHQSKLKKFRLYSHYNHLSESLVNSWIRYAVNCNVEDLNLRLWCLERGTEFPLDQSVFISSSFTNLALSGCSFNPTGAISWKNLRSLHISFIKLDEELIENILSGSPALETLEWNSCYGCRRLNITSKSVKKLVLTICMIYLSDDRANVIEINAPNISSLTIQGDMWLRRLLLLNVSSLVEVHLDFTIGEDDDEEDTLKEVILNLQHVKDFQIGPSCFDVLTRLEAKGFVYPSNLKVSHEVFHRN